MNINLFDYIKRLSENDKKTLSQKGLKVCEEAGELAKVILPFDNAPSTLHRFVDKNRILEEAVDVMLTAISIPYELGFNNDDIEEMMLSKAEKWHGLQTKENSIIFPIPFEIHISVSIVDEMIPAFKTLCNKLGVKPIVIDLEKNGVNVMRDVMTSSHFFGNNSDAYYECNRISEGLERNGFIVIRKKIETIPWHPAAPTNDSQMPKDCYFEAHINCIINDSEKKFLNQLVKEHNGHLSKNFFKKISDDKFVNMVTVRWYVGTHEKVLSDLDKLKNDLKKNNIVYEKLIVEFCIYDTKVSHDFKWLKKENNE